MLNYYGTLDGSLKSSRFPSDKIDVHINCEEAFENACINNYIEIVKLFLSLTGPDKTNVHVNDEGGFWFACANGHIEIVKLLLALKGPDKINIHIANDDAFNWACRSGRIDVIKLLLKEDNYVFNPSLPLYCNNSVMEILLSVADDETINEFIKNVGLRFIFQTVLNINNPFLMLKVLKNYDGKHTESNIEKFALNISGCKINEDFYIKDDIRNLALKKYITILHKIKMKMPESIILTENIQRFIVL